MFTGIVEELGAVESFDGTRLQVRSPEVLADAVVGSSIAVNGCCLTVVAIQDGSWWSDVSEETLARTSIGTLHPGAPVNLERPLALGARLGGHVVQGHVDGVGVITAPAPDLRVKVPEPLLRYVVEKGSVTVDGVSLTVAEIAAEEITIAVIPHTAEVTTLGARRPGDAVNLEVDVLAKYVERLLGRSEQPGA